MGVTLLRQLILTRFDLFVFMEDASPTSRDDLLDILRVFSPLHVQSDTVFHLARDGCFIIRHDVLPTAVDLTRVRLVGLLCCERVYRHAEGFVNGHSIRPIDHMRRAHDTVRRWPTSNTIVLALKAVHEVSWHLVRLRAVTTFLLNRVDLVVRNDTTICTLSLVELLMFAELRQEISIDDVFICALIMAKVLVGAAGRQYRLFD